MYTGPHIKRDGLVFGYDTGRNPSSNFDHRINKRRHFRGKPTSNVLETEANWIYIGTEITDPTNYPVPLPKEVKFEKGASQGGMNWSDACRNYTDSYAAGTQITVSGWHMFYSTDTSLIMNGRTRLGWHYNKDGVSTFGGTIYTATEWNKWYYFSHTFSSTGVTTNLRVEDGGYDYYLSSEDAAKTTQYYCNLQVEVGTDIVSPYVKGTRSSAQSLLDLTKTTDIDVSNVSFDSNGLPTFDGTDDGIQISTATNLSSYSALTYEGVVKGAGIGAYDRWFSGTSGTSVHYPDLAIDSSGLLRYLHSSFSTPWVSTGVSITTNKYNHIVFTFQNNGNTELFLNGSSVYTASHNSGTFPSVSRFMIGSRYDRNGEAIVGQIPVMKIYSRALSLQEVKQNFRAYKNRFGL